MVCLKLEDIRRTNVAVREARSTSIWGKSAYTRILAPGTRYMIASAAHDDIPVPKI